MDYKSGYYIGIDVGTQSVRAGLVSEDGKVVATSSHPITTLNPYPDLYEQSSEEIWQACVSTTKDVTKGINKDLIRGIGFDATCSLVVLDKNMEPASVSRTGLPNQNIVLWMDHRAVEEADFINSLSHPVLKFVGGKLSPEMEPPKLLWLKKNLPSQWEKYGYFFDLPDFLTWRATGSFTRSLCSLVCKWTYQAGMDTMQGWQDDFWKEIGLGDLINNNYKKIGHIAVAPGEPCGNGLTNDAAKEMDLNPGVPVGASIIDAHAGGLGVLLCSSGSEPVVPLENRMALICGTSTCHLIVNKEAIFTNGIWGPYFSATVPGLWSSEAGQSAAGVLLDYIIENHSAYQQLKQACKGNRYITELLNDELEILYTQKGLPSLSYLTADLHVWPDYHGNRSPLADPNLKGMVCGLTLSADTESLAKQYLATVQSLAYSTKHIISSLKDSGHDVQMLLVSGGLSKNPLYVQMHADITGLPVIIPHEPESVLLGAALLGARAANDHESVVSAMTKMCGSGNLVKPKVSDSQYHEQKYLTFLKLLECQKDIQNLMKHNEH